MPNNEAIAELGSDISRKVHEFVVASQDKRGRAKLAVAEPEKACKALIGLATGLPKKRIARELGMDKSTLYGLYSDFADYMGEWKEQAGKVSGALYFEGADIIGDLYAKIQDHMDTPETLETYSKALTGVTKSVEALSRQSMTARGENVQRIKVERTMTKEDVDEAAKEALAAIQEAEIVED